MAPSATWNSAPCQTAPATYKVTPTPIYKFKAANTILNKKLASRLRPADATRVLRRNCAPSKRAAVPFASSTRALLPQPLAAVLDVAALAAVTGGLALSALPLLTGKAAKQNANRPFNEDSEEEDFLFSLASGIAILPYANWTAWVLRAFNEESNAALYYAIATAYAVPWVTHDLRLDGFTVLMLLLGAVHVQVDRVAATQPVELRVPGLSAIAQQLSSAIASPVREVASAVNRKQLSASEGQPPPGQEDKTGESTEEYDKRQLREFDDMLKSREQQDQKRP